MRTICLLLITFVYLFSLSRSGCGPASNSATSVYWEPQTIFYANLRPKLSSFNYQGLTWSLTNNGLIKVTESNGHVVFLAGSPADCSHYCALNFQHDGNLVIYYSTKGGTYNRGDHGASWASHTDHNLGRYLQFLTIPPYVQVVASNCTVVWPGSSTGEPTVNVARTTPVETAVNSAAQQYNQYSAPANIFSVSVNFPSIPVKIRFMHHTVDFFKTRTLRVISPDGSIEVYEIMNPAGVKLDVIAQGTTNISGLASQVSAWAAFQNNTGMIQSIEGFNKINLFPFTYNGINPNTSFRGMFQAQQDLYSLVKANPILKLLPVYDFTGECFAPFSVLDGLDCHNISGRADWTNLQIFPIDGEELIGLGSSDNYIQMGLDMVYGPEWNATNNVISEIGWHIDSFQNGVTEASAAKLYVNTLLSALAAGNPKTFIYQLVDEECSGYDGPECHFGLFYSNQTAKPSARALHFLSFLLNDTGPGLSSLLTYTLANFPYTAQRFLFQNTAQTYFLVLWINLPVYNPISQTDFIYEAINTTFTLPWSTTINVFDIFSTTASDTEPLTPLSSVNASSISFPFSDKAVVLSFDPPPTAPTPTPTPTSCPNVLDTILQDLSVSSSSLPAALTSLNCLYTLTISPSDGSLQINDGSTMIYTSENSASGPGPYNLVMQVDGNLVTYDAVGSPIWSTETGFLYGYLGLGPFNAVLDNNGILHVIDTSNNYSLWSS